MLAAFYQWREQWGQNVIMPLSESIRHAVEGEEVVRAPNYETRWFVPRETSAFFEPTFIAIVLAIAFTFNLLEPITRNVIGKVCNWLLLFLLVSWCVCDRPFAEIS